MKSVSKGLVFSFLVNFALLYIMVIEHSFMNKSLYRKDKFFCSRALNSSEFGKVQLYYSPKHSNSINIKGSMWKAFFYMNRMRIRKKPMAKSLNCPPKIEMVRLKRFMESCK